MTLATKRWNDPVLRTDGTRILITRYRPRGLRKGRETWDEWMKQVAPSAALLSDFHGKHGPPIGWSEYRRCYLHEMRAQRPAIAALAERLRRGESLTLLCSAACTDPEMCHRTLLKELVETELGHAPAPERAERVPERFSKLKSWL